MGEFSGFEESKLKLEEAKLIFDEYKLGVEDTARFADRRERITSTYVTLNSLILGAIALLLRESNFVIGWEAVVIIPLLLAGIMACIAWRQGLRNFSTLINLRIHKLRELETLPAMRSHLQIYHAEDELYPAKPTDSKRLTFSNLYHRLPGMLIIIYFSAFVIIVYSITVRVVGF